MPDLPKDAAELLLLARTELDNDKAERALSIIHTVLRREPKNPAAENLLIEAERRFIAQFYAKVPPTGILRLTVRPEELAAKQIGPQEGFVLSRINGQWDIESILSICPFREADSLRMIKSLLDNGVISL